MLTLEKLREIIATWKYDISNTLVFNREIYHLVREQFLKQPPVVLHGLRRSGKTYLMYKLMKDFPESVYINFEDERFGDAKSEILDEIYSVYMGDYSPERPVMLLDEIQNIKGWEKFVARLHSKVKFVVSGSNATLLSSEYSSALTGRHIPLRIHQLSFSEYVKANDNQQLDRLISEDRAKIRVLFSDFMNYGGFPQASLQKDKFLLKSTFDAIIYRDVIPRFDIRNPLSLERLARYLVSNPGKMFSYRNLCSVTNIKHEDTVKSYFDYLEKAYLLFGLARFDYSLKKQSANLKKAYPADTSFTKYSGLSFSEDRGRLLETIILQYFIRKEYDLFYWKDETGLEVDFVVSEGLKPVTLVQVCDSGNNESTWKREIRSLLKAAEKLKSVNLFLITNTPIQFPVPENIVVKSAIDLLLEG